MNSGTGYPIQHDINSARNKAFKNTYREERRDGIENTTGRKVANLVAHKEFLLISLPVNVACGAISTTAMVCGGAILGTPKILTFALTCGTYRPTYSTGVIRNGEVMFHSIANLFIPVGQLVYEGGYGVYKVGCGMHWVAEKIHCGGTFKRIEETILIGMGDIALRIALGIANAAEREPKHQHGSPIGVAWINNPTTNKRIDFGSSERSLIDIVSHKALSIINIPVNAAACVLSGAIAVPLSACFIGKAAVNAITTLDIPGATFAGASWVVFGKTLSYVGQDVGLVAVDSGVLLYKLAVLTRINRVATSAIDFVIWSVGAIFS